ITCASWFTSRLHRKVLKSTQLPISAGIYTMFRAAKVHSESSVIFHSPPAFLQYSCGEFPGGWTWGLCDGDKDKFHSFSTYKGEPTVSAIPTTRGLISNRYTLRRILLEIVID